MFADDLKLVADATNINDISNDLIELENWEDLWQLRFNAMYFGFLTFCVFQ